MEAARRARLSRRRPPLGGGAPSAPNPRPGSPRDGGSECARLWAELMRTTGADLGADGEPPPLPAFPRQEPTRDPEPAAPPEVFTVGSKTFTWTPFPPAPRGAEGTGRSYRVIRGAGVRPTSPARAPRGCTAPQPPEVPSAQAPRGCTAPQPPEVPSAQAPRGCTAPQPPEVPSAQAPRGCTAPQPPEVPSAGAPQGCTAPQPPEVPSARAQPVADAAQTLQSCPLCQADFAPGLAQLDIDSHLAQCLADSTEDVVW